jgi:hypothetical protein
MQAVRSQFVPALVRPGGSGRGARHARLASPIRRYAIRGVFVLVLAFASLAALAWAAHPSSHASHHHRSVATNVVPKGWML